MALGDYAKIEKALYFLDRHAERQPSLQEVAAEVGLSEFHFQRLFQRWAGVSPKRFLQYVTLRKAKEMLTGSNSKTLLQTSLALGLSGTSRLHDLFLKLECMTPGEYKKQAKGLTIYWSLEQTPFGPALFAVLGDRGLCGLSFFPSREASNRARERALKVLRAQWSGAKFKRSSKAIAPYVDGLRRRISGRTDQPISLVLKGTPFQFKVWEALLQIPIGHVVNYGKLAERVGLPKASRAVGSAVGRNSIAYLIPCHRVIQSTGTFGKYRWGSDRKRIILALERTMK